MPKVIWRGATAEQYEKGMVLHELVHGATAERFRSTQKNNPLFDPSFTRICLEGDLIASIMHIYPRRIVIGGAVMGNMAIGDVATHPDRRKRGYGAGCLRDCIRWAEENDCPVSMILSGVFGFYLSEKWVKFPQHSYTIDLTKFRHPKPARDYSVRWIERDTDDLEQCMDVYNAYNADNSLAIVRTPLYWRRRLRWQSGESAGGWFVAERDGAIVAYMRSQGPRISEMCFLPGHAEASFTLFDALVRWAGRRELTQLSADLADDNPVRLALDKGEGVVRNTSETTLLRFIDLRRVFACLWEKLQLRFLRSGLDFKGEVCFKAQGVRQQVTLAFHDRELSLAKRPGPDARTLALEQADLFKLITGYGRFQDLPLGSLDKTASALLRALFPRGKCHFWRNDTV